jgi:hypothetical protein
MKKTTNKKKLKNNVINKNYEAFVKILPTRCLRNWEIII